MLSIPGSHAALLQNKRHDLATCWRITRDDGLILRFTDHSNQLVIGTETFVPVNGVNSSARELQSGLKTSNASFQGIVSDSAITASDLRAGLYKEAKIEELTVNWRFPFWGEIATTVFYIDSVQIIDNELWQCEVSGVARQLRQFSGRLLSRNCTYDVGDSDCTVNLTPFTFTAQVTQVNTQRKSFETDLAAQVDDYFQYGYLTWTSGNNNGITVEIQRSFQSNSTLFLALSLPRDIQVGDDFTITAGCDGLVETCKVKFNNFVNFGGEPFMPGTDRMLEVPE